MKIQAIRPFNYKTNFNNKANVQYSTPALKADVVELSLKNKISFTSNSPRTLLDEANLYIEEVKNPFGGVLDKFQDILESGGNLIYISRTVASDIDGASWDAKYLSEDLIETFKEAQQGKFVATADAFRNSLIVFRNDDSFGGKIGEEYKKGKLISTIRETLDGYEITQYCEDGTKNIALISQDTNEPIEYQVGVLEDEDGFHAKMIYYYEPDNGYTRRKDYHLREDGSSSWANEFCFDKSGIKSISYDCISTSTGMKIEGFRYDYKNVGEYEVEKLISASEGYKTNAIGTWKQIDKQFDFENNCLKSCAFGLEYCPTQGKVEADRVYIFSNKNSLNNVYVNYSSENGENIAQKCFVYNFKTNEPQDCYFNYNIKRQFHQG